MRSVGPENSPFWPFNSILVRFPFINFHNSHNGTILLPHNYFQSLVSISIIIFLFCFTGPRYKNKVSLFLHYIVDFLNIYSCHNRRTVSSDIGGMTC